MSNFNLDFIINPLFILHDKRLRRLDSDVYGVIHGLSQMSSNGCTATNETIGKVVVAEGSTVKKSISRLYKFGYVRCFYNDEKNKRQIVLPRLNNLDGGLGYD